MARTASRPLWPVLPTALVAALSTVALLAGCTGGSGDLAVDEPGGVPPEGSTAEAEPEGCRVEDVTTAPMASFAGDPVAISTGLAAATHRCAETVVVAPADDAWLAAVAVPLALAADAPLLLAPSGTPGGLAAELERLDPEEVLAIGVDGSAAAPGATTIGPVPPPPPAPTPGTDSGTSAAGPTTSSGATVTSAPAATDTDTDTDTDSGTDTDTGTGTGGAAAPDGDAAATSTTAPGAGAGAVVPIETAAALAIVEHLEAEEVLVVPVDDQEARAAIGGHLDTGRALLPLPSEARARAAAIAALPEDVTVTVLSSDPAAGAAIVAELTAAGRSAVAAGSLWGEDPAATAWLVDPAQGAAVAAAVAAATARDEPVLPVDLADLRRGRDRTARLRAVGPDRVVVVGGATPHLDWQLPLVLEGPPLPGGGFALFDDERMVALYGHPQGGALGVLGEEDLDTTVERARQVAAPYGADGVPVLPAFEIIATVASAEAGAGGDYSRRTPIDILRPYVDRAAAEGFYVVLDLQSGRTDFLTQAQEYQELLRLPHVGLALDPEWRLGPDEVHLRQIGSVEAAEVQQVADWLARFTRENQLPQKLLVLHQFRHDMLPDRDTVIAPPELAVVIHMDGQGPIGSKDGTYRAITQGVEDRWLWGWKNFYDEDIPTPTPEHVLALDPLPVFVTYQ